jgi:peptide/nickel transport system permease protein
VTTESTHPPDSIDALAVAPAGGPAAIEARSQRSIVWNRFKRHRVGAFGGLILLLLIAMAVVYPMVSPFSADEFTTEVQNTGPGWPHVFGTGPLGEDIFVEVWTGGRTSLLVGLAAALGATVIGGVLGALAGYFGRWVDAIITLITDVFLAAPTLAVLVALGAVLGKLSVTMIVVVIGLLTWMQVTRLIRAEFFALKEREFVLAARAVGASPFRIMRKHLLPNAVSVLVVSATLLVATAIILEATLSFLGVGLDILSNPSWGNLLERAKEGALLGYWWAIVFPGLAIILTCLSVNFLGDALRDALDPHAMEGREK